MLKRNDIIERLMLKGYTKKDAGTILNDVFDVITEALIKEESVQIYGFGTFEVKNIASRETVDFNKDRIIIPSYRAPKFTAGDRLKRAIKEGFVRD